MLNKKGQSQFPTIKTILILLTSTFILIGFVLILSKLTTISVDEKEVNTQLITKQILNGKCFSQSYATIKQTQFDKDHLEKCLKGSKDEVLLQIMVNEFDSNKGWSPLYSPSEKKFKEKAEFCGINSNLKCTTKKFPITTLSSSGKTSTRELILHIIAQ